MIVLLRKAQPAPPDSESCAFPGNPVIRGWASYHRNIVAKRAFDYVDNQIWRKIWQWCKRRHHNKGSEWVYRKYFRYSRTGTYRWLFCGKDRSGKIWELMLSSSIPISRHIKIRSEANFYNPRRETYFERRQDNIWAESQKGKRRIAAI
ncbi:group II intron maturase-specific domain-containing protein [Kosakonia sp. S42]|uniref:group II intron maturase-specific domain-containing protein n=1 Tax=Kosakonia sp. S42 TaxID=2767458 RepID=UPI0035C7CE70